MMSLLRMIVVQQKYLFWTKKEWSCVALGDHLTSLAWRKRLRESLECSLHASCIFIFPCTSPCTLSLLEAVYAPILAYMYI